MNRGCVMVVLGKGCTTCCARMRLLELGADGAGRIVAVVRVVDVLLCEEGDDDEGEEEVVALSSLRFWSNFLAAIDVVPSRRYRRRWRSRGR